MHSGAISIHVQYHHDRKLNLVHMSKCNSLLYHIAMPLLHRSHAKTLSFVCSLRRVRLQPSSIRLLSTTNTTGAVGVAQKTDKHKKAKPFDKVTGSQRALLHGSSMTPKAMHRHPKPSLMIAAVGIHKRISAFICGISTISMFLFSKLKLCHAITRF